jgi:hypothetical protein
MTLNPPCLSLNLAVIPSAAEGSPAARTERIRGDPSAALGMTRPPVGRRGSSMRRREPSVTGEKK